MAHSPIDTIEDTIPPGDAREMNRKKFLDLPHHEQSRIYGLYYDAKVYNKWFAGLSKKDKKTEYSWLYLDGDGKKINKNKFQIVEDKALRIRMVKKIEKLKKDGKLDKRYKLK